MQLELLFYVNVRFISQDINKDNKNLLVYRLIVSKPNKYVGLDLT